MRRKSRNGPFDRTEEAYEKVAKDEARKLSTVQEIMIIAAQITCDASLRQRGGKETLRCHTCARIVTVSRRKTTLWWVSGRKKHTNGWCAICGEKFDGKQPNRLLVVQTSESVNQAKVFRAHAVLQGFSGNLITALKLLANQQEDGDGLTQSIVTKLCEREQEGPHGGAERIYTS